MIRRWLGKCEERDSMYGVVYCKLRPHGHAGDCHFGILRTATFTMDLDAPIHVTDRLPTEPAMPPAPFALPPPAPDRHCCCCRCGETS